LEIIVRVFSIFNLLFLVFCTRFKLFRITSVALLVTCGCSLRHLHYQERRLGHALRLRPQRLGVCVLRLKFFLFLLPLDRHFIHFLFWLLLLHSLLFFHPLIFSSFTWVNYLKFVIGWLVLYCFRLNNWVTSLMIKVFMPFQLWDWTLISLI